MQIHPAICLREGFLESRDEGGEYLIHLANSNQSLDQVLLFLYLSMVDQLLQGICPRGRLLGIGVINHWQAKLLIQQLLQLRPTVRIEFLVIKGCALLG